MGADHLIVGSFMIGVLALLMVAVALLTGRTGATDTLGLDLCGLELRPKLELDEHLDEVAGS